jgi:hypothetical protein
MGDVGYMRLRRVPLLDLPKEGFTQQEWDELTILQWQTKSLVAEGKEPPLWVCGEEARSAGGFGDIPRDRAFRRHSGLGRRPEAESGPHTEIKLSTEDGGSLQSGIAEDHQQ